MVLMAEHAPPPGTSAEGVGLGRRQMVLAESIIQEKIIYLLLSLCQLQQSLTRRCQ